jgi:hypothetical protein
MSTDRADPLALDVSGFVPVTAMPAARPPAQAIREVSEAHNFPSRAPARTLRRRRTGRNMQVNIKATRETIEKLVAISDAQHWPFGETLEYALAALARELGAK